MEQLKSFRRDQTSLSIYGWSGSPRQNGDINRRAACIIQTATELVTVVHTSAVVACTLNLVAAGPSYQILYRRCARVARRTRER